MSVRFRNAPLAELVAEIRWTVPPLPMQASGINLPAGMPLPIDSITASSHEELFKKFILRIGAEGYGLVERLVPANFPMMMQYQPIYRFRKASGDTNTLFQIGNGVFTANATAPYKSWKEFRPVVEKGIVALFECLDEERKKQLSQVSLRYIDIFSGDFQAGLPIWKFVSDVLGIKIQLPQKISDYCTNLNDIKPVLQFGIPVSIGMVNMVIAEGAVGSTAGYLLDTTTIVQKDIQPNTAAILEILDKARDIVHFSFVDMTKPIKNVMQPLDD